MAKLIILKGLPASGKSTLAEKIVRESGNTVRVNRDLLRTMLHFGKWSGRNEGKTIDAEKSLILTFLRAGTNVVVDDTNLGLSGLRWVDLANSEGFSTEIIRVDTPIEECIARDEKRLTKVGKNVIMKFAMLEHIWEPKSRIVICDIDGTLADITHRLKYVKDCEKKEWKRFFAECGEDPVREDVYNILKGFQNDGHPVVLVSGRPEEYRWTTQLWLDKNGIEYDALLMRGIGDKRDDDVVKQEIYDKYLKHYPIECVIDDRPRVIRMWRKNNLVVVDVGSGVEF